MIFRRMLAVTILSLVLGLHLGGVFACSCLPDQSYSAACCCQQPTFLKPCHSTACLEGAMGRADIQHCQQQALLTAGTLSTISGLPQGIEKRSFSPPISAMFPAGLIARDSPGVTASLYSGENQKTGQLTFLLTRRLRI